MKKILSITLLLFTIKASCKPEGQGVTKVPNYTKLADNEIKYLQNKGFGPEQRSGVDAYEYEEEHYEVDNEPEQSQYREPTYANYPAQTRTTPIKNYPAATPKTSYYASVTPKAYKAGAEEETYHRNGQLGPEEEELEKEEEPDRLTLLLPQSKFQCTGRKTGYYADQNLGCEVFHYCHENARHSWICPEGFTFHQVHLICMPPGGDNICDKSADYHFVNDFLYKPVNLEEYQQKPNVTLRYSDRYFPDAYRPRYDDDDGDARPTHHQHSIRVTNQPRYQSIPSTTFRPQTPLGQVFRSPEEINISLQQRRPQFSTSKLIDAF
ncbi:uncharacterized protein LOC132704078 [Cylas formicarius]|uniref:uncharacterized protein LOC132704078 n=1 Tax=Cylas formicarius TaxID=197179 RepID=UPI0029583E99|nr:uncharacterized protein LOC132704078 [Cylas formicarius]